MKFSDRRWAAQRAIASALAVLPACAAAPSSSGAVAEVYVPPDAGEAQQLADPDASGPGAETRGTAAMTLLPPGDPVEAVFNTGYFAKARDVIQTAQKKLRIVQFEVSSGDYSGILLAAVIKAKQRGVDVRVLFDEEVTYNKDAVAQLQAAGVTVKFDSPKIRTHAKVVASEQGFVIGSTNWSTSSMSKNNETDLLVRDDAAITQLHAWLDKLWADSSKSLAMPGGSSKQIQLYADGGFFPLVAPLIDAAKTRILLCTYGMNIDTGNASAQVTQLVQKIAAAQKRGVQVRVLLDQSSDWNDVGTDINAESGAYLQKLGLQVRADAKTVITHAKFLVVDDALVAGSNNWGYGGMQGYHEVGGKVTQSAPVAAYVNYFEKLWADSTALAP